jgi:putative flippase GtrA
MDRRSDAFLLAGFVGVGAVGFMTDAGLLATGIALGLSPIVARGISVVVALQLTFLLNGLLVFRSLTPAALAGQWLAYMVSNGLGAACNYAIFVTLTVSRIPWLSDRAPAFVAAAGIALVVNFAGTRFWAFRQAGASR